VRARARAHLETFNVTSYVHPTLMHNGNAHKACVMDMATFVSCQVTSRNQVPV